MEEEVLVGDRYLGIGGGWEDLVVEVIFVAPDGKTGDVLLPDGEDVGVDFRNFRKISNVPLLAVESTSE
jgi:hypothetical protein